LTEFTSLYTLHNSCLCCITTEERP